MNTYQSIEVSQEGHVATITFKRDEVLNAFNKQLRADVKAAVDWANAEDSVRVVVLTGGPRAFGAGADLSEKPPLLVQQQLDEEYKPVLLAITQSPKVFIAAVNGAAAGISSAFVMACDLAVMGEKSYIYQAFVAIGLIPDGGATWHLLNELGRKRAFELIADGEKLPAKRCLDLGLCNRVVADDAVLAEAQQWAASLAQKAPLALRYAKEALTKGSELNLGDAISYEAKLQNLCVASDDAKEGITAFMEKRAPDFKGS
jgi:2-(1,2-epoxy-1,2-dihydrophenyl)acetyl-CoA isomerase